MNVFVSKRCRCVTVSVVVALIVQITCCAAAPLPQRIISPTLARNDCVAGVSEESFAPYIQEFLLTDAEQGISFYSCINWWHGFLKSEGSGKYRSRLAAELVAKSNALKTLVAANLNAQATLQEYFERKNAVMLKIQNVLVRGAQVQEPSVDPKKPDEVRVLVTIPFYGIAGLISFFLDDEEIFLKRTPEVVTTNETTDVVTTSDYTGVLIDARELKGVEPAFFPKIVSTEGEVLYSASQVDREVLVKQGMVKYGVEQPQQVSEFVGAHPLLIKPVLLVSTAPYHLLADVKSREGKGKGHHLVLEGQKSAGQLPVNIVISVEDARKLKELNQKRQFDQQGQYLILIGREIAGDKGQYPASIMVMRNE